MDKAAKLRLVQALTLHDVTKPHQRANGRPCWCYKEAERIIRDIEAAGFEIVDTRPREGEIKVNIHVDGRQRCMNCGSAFIG